MIKFKINHSKNFVPLSIAKGSQEQRMQKACSYNLAFYDNIQDCIRKNEIAPRTFINKLNSTIGAKLGINIINVEKQKDAQTSYYFNDKCKSIGYAIELPKSSFSNNNIHKNSARTFLIECQNMLNEAFNPKILQRYVVLFNKGYDITSIKNFYKNNISQTAELKAENLEKFLENKSNTEKIDSLQFIRYKLMSEKNSTEAIEQIDKRIEKHNNFKFVNSSDYYDNKKYQFDEKIEILNKALLNTIKNERS